MEQRGFYLVNYGANGDLQGKRTKKQPKQNNPHLQKKGPGSGSLFHIFTKSPQNPIISPQNLPISRKNRFATEIYAGNINYHYPNYVTYDIIIFQICRIRHNSLLIVSHTTFSNLYYVIYDIICFLKYVIYDIMIFLLCHIRHNPD